MSKEIMDYGFGVIETRERFYTEQYVNELNQRIAELEEQLKKSLESNNDLLKQIMELQSQLIVERLKGQPKD